VSEKKELSAMLLREQQDFSQHVAQSREAGTQHQADMDALRAKVVQLETQRNSFVYLITPHLIAIDFRLSVRGRPIQMHPFRCSSWSSATVDGPLSLCKGAKRR
jgi:hypothetical protein